ncbi:MAG: helix-turn-helix domain-containing protein [Planctomycetota bacterium]|jgi:transcriptional regulator with XRE-family HTH domain
MSDINKDVGFNIRRMREEKGFSQEKLAALADLHRAYIGQIERGEKNIGLKNLQKIANALGVHTKDLL